MNTYIESRDWAEALGKALFWDQNIGSDGVACASCHFHAGADSRTKHQLNPGPNGYFDITKGGGRGPNYTMVEGDFPFHVLSDPTDRNSPIVFSTDDRMSSQGTRLAKFISTSTGVEICEDIPDEVFYTWTEKDPSTKEQAWANLRRVEPRNAPTTINAVFNFRNFWDGRANNIFNGQNAFGRRDPDAHIKKWDGAAFSNDYVRLRNASLASQAVAPAVSDLEMSCAGRGHPDIAKKMLELHALSTQPVHPNDSVFGSGALDIVDGSGIGLQLTYSQMIDLAFQAPWRAGVGAVDGSGLTQKEFNWAFFFGLAIYLYEATLVSGESPFDNFMGGALMDDEGGPQGDANALTDQQKLGMSIFLTKGKCVNCHEGPEFTGASLTALVPEDAEEGLVERMRMVDQEGRPALYDNGFYNIGTRPTSHDHGVGGYGKFGHPLSFTRQYLNFLETWDPSELVDNFEIDPCKFEVKVGEENLPEGEPSAEPCDPVHPDAATERLAVDGAFKVPGLRNVAMTGPYFHSGNYYSLRQVVEFYNRGGDRRGNLDRGGDTSGTGLLGRNDTAGCAGESKHDAEAHECGSNLDPDIQELGLTEDEIDALVAFMESLTDPRVVNEEAPFDHPALVIFKGAPGDPDSVAAKPGSETQAMVHGQSITLVQAEDIEVVSPAVGYEGRTVENLEPLQTFAQIILEGGEGEAPPVPMPSIGATGAACLIALLAASAGVVRRRRA